MSNPDSDGFSHQKQGSDRVVNDETRRALRRRGRQAGMILTGAFVALVIFAVPGFVAVLSVPWQLAVAVTVGAALVAPIAVPYAMLRVVGLSHRDVVYVEKQAYREAVTEAIALSGTGRTADVFTESSKSAEPTESAEESQNPSSEKMDVDQNSAESEPTDPQQTNTEPQS